jgi:hypothetical protein
MSQDEHKTEESAETPAQNDGDQAQDEQIVRLDNFFSSLQPGVSVLIERLKPSWCSGLLEEIQITEDGIDLDYLIETWGGQLLSVKMRGRGGRLVGGSYKVPLYSYPPLRFGQKIRPYDKGERFLNGDEATPAPAPAAPVVVNQPPGLEKILSALPAVMPLVMNIMERSEARNQQNMNMMMAMMKANNGGGLADITKIGAVMTQLNELFRNQSGGGDAGPSEMDFMGQAMDVIKMFMSNKPAAVGPQMPMQPPPQARLTGGNAPPPTGSTPQKAPAPVPAPAPNVDATVTPLNPVGDIADELAGMEPDEITGTLLASISKMSPEKRDAAIANFMGGFQDFMMGGDDGIEEEGEYQEEEQRGVK